LRLGQHPPSPGASSQEEQQHLHERVVARYNRVRLISNSDDVVAQAAQILINIEEWLILLEQSTVRQRDVHSLRQAYDRSRLPYLDAVKRETGISP